MTVFFLTLRREPSRLDVSFQAFFILPLFTLFLFDVVLFCLRRRRAPVSLMSWNFCVLFFFPGRLPPSSCFYWFCSDFFFSRARFRSLLSVFQGVFFGLPVISGSVFSNLRGCCHKIFLGHLPSSSCI